MDLAPTADQERLCSDVRALLERRAPPERVRSLERSERGFCTELWDEMVERGWLRHGAGAVEDGLSLVDRALVFEALGRAATPGPFLAQCEAIFVLEELELTSAVEGLATGAARASLALLEASGIPDLESMGLVTEESGRLSGRKLFVPWVPDVAVLLVVARSLVDDRPALVAVDPSAPGLRWEAMPRLDPERLFALELEGVTGEVLAQGPAVDVARAVERAQARATILACAELAGAAAAALGLAVEYAGRREQFGKPIGSFQAIQHHCANMAMDADAARLAALDAAAQVDAGGSPECSASRAKVICSEAARRVTTTAHQVLGGIGFLEDVDLQLFTRRVKALESRLGTPDWHRERIADALALPD